MMVNIGGKIRQLRKQKNISQEILAQAMGVSFQAVSKWETCAAMPDVAIIPAIASFFGVSTDELFDFNLIEQEKKVQELCWAAADHRFTDPAKAEAMLREALKQYPGNEVILNNLLYVMQTPDRYEEVVTVCKSILEITRDDEVKYDVLRILAKTYHDMGQQNLVKPTLEQIPELYFSKLELMANLLEGDEALQAARMHANISRDDLLDMLSRMSQLYREKGDTVLAEKYAGLTKAVHAIFVGDEDGMDYIGRRTVWLAEDIWPRLG